MQYNNIVYGTEIYRSERNGWMRRAAGSRCARDLERFANNIAIVASPAIGRRSQTADRQLIHKTWLQRCAQTDTLMSRDLVWACVWNILFLFQSKHNPIIL